MRQRSDTGVDSLVSLTRSQLAEIFRGAAAGETPTGRARGSVLVGLRGPGSRLAAVLTRALLWKGKVVDRGAARVRNRLTPLDLLAVEGQLYRGDSWFDGRECIVIDYSKTSRVARKIRDEIREIGPGIYLGLAFFKRRHVLDFVLDFRRR